MILDKYKIEETINNDQTLIVKIKLDKPVKFGRVKEICQRIQNTN
jgi:hypothetical protein